MVGPQCSDGKMHIFVVLLCEGCACREYSYYSPRSFHPQQEAQAQAFDF